MIQIIPVKERKEDQKDTDKIFYIPNERTYLLKADNTDEYCLTIENMQPKNVYYYVVTLKEQVKEVFHQLMMNLTQNL